MAACEKSGRRAATSVNVLHIATRRDRPKPQTSAGPSFLGRQKWMRVTPRGRERSFGGEQSKRQTFSSTIAIGARNELFNLSLYDRILTAMLFIVIDGIVSVTGSTIHKAF